MKKVFGFIVMLALGGLMYMAVIERRDWASNLFLFYTWLSFIGWTVRISDKDLKPKTLESYRKGEHFPLWLDNIIYAFFVIPLIANGWWFTGVAWLLKWLMDYGLREMAKKPAAKLSEETGEI